MRLPTIKDSVKLEIQTAGLGYMNQKSTQKLLDRNIMIQKLKNLNIILHFLIQIDQEHFKNNKIINKLLTDRLDRHNIQLSTYL